MTDYGFKAAAADSFSIETTDIVLKALNAVGQASEVEKWISWVEKCANVWPEKLAEKPKADGVSQLEELLAGLKSLPIGTEEQTARALRFYGAVAKAARRGPLFVPDSWIDDVAEGVRSGSRFYEQVAEKVAEHCPDRMTKSLYLAVVENAVGRNPNVKSEERRVEAYQSLSVLIVHCGIDAMRDTDAKIIKTDATTPGPLFEGQANRARFWLQEYNTARHLRLKGWAATYAPKG